MHPMIEKRWNDYKYKNHTSRTLNGDLLAVEDISPSANVAKLVDYATWMQSKFETCRPGECEPALRGISARCKVILDAADLKMKDENTPIIFFSINPY